MKVQLVALKNFTYGRSRLREGQEFAASRADARLFAAVSLAQRVMERPAETRKAVPAPADEAEIPQPTSGGSLDELRAEFYGLVGAQPDRRWGPARMATEIAALKAAAVGDSDQAMEI